MKKKICLFVLVLVVVASCFAENSGFVEINENSKTKTSVSLNTKNKKILLPEAFKLCVIAGDSYFFSDCEVELYSKKELLKVFDDELIYGSAVSAVINLHYGFVMLDYFKYDDEPESLVGWDKLFFFTLENDKVLCLKLVE